MLKGSTDTLKEATPNKMMETLEPPCFSAGRGPSSRQLIQ